MITRDELFLAINKSAYPTAVTTYDFNNPEIVFVNKEHEKLTEYSSVELIGKNPRIFQGVDTNKDVVAQLKDGLSEFDSWSGSILNYTKSGKPYNVSMIIFGILTDSGERFYVAVNYRPTKDGSAST